MNIKLLLAASAGVLAVTLAGCTTPASNEVSNLNDEESMMNDSVEQDDTMMEDEEAMESDDAMMDNDDSIMNDEDTMMEDEDSEASAPAGAAVPGSYEEYDASKLSAANDGDVVLFFHAGWCPTCRALDSDLEDSLNDIPEGVTILQVDYDTETELRQKYGVTYQHTLVQVDADGNQITKWSGGNTLESVLENLD